MRRDPIIKTASIAGASDLTILAPIKKGLVPALDAVTYKTRVKRVLRLLHLGRTLSHEYEIGRVLSDAVERVGKIHSIRIAILEPEDKVLLVVTFDGAWESYIRVIWQKVSRLLDLIFCNTEGYKLGWESTFDEWCAWLRGAQAETLFLYSQPNLTNTDTHYLQSIERIQRRTSDAVVADLDIAKYSVASAEAKAQRLWSEGVDLDNKPYGQKRPSVISSSAFRQGLRTLVGLYRLSDVYMATVGDGAVLHRAAQEMLIEFKEMLPTEDDLNLDFAFGFEKAYKHYPDALNWFLTLENHHRTNPYLPKDQNSLISDKADNIQGGILEPYAERGTGCLLLIAFNNRSGMAKFLGAFTPTSVVNQATIDADVVTQNISITLEGLRLAGFDDDEISELPEEFVQGMDKRQGVLGDLYTNHPRRWSLPISNWTEGIDAENASRSSVKPRVQLSSVHAIIQLRGRFDTSFEVTNNKLLASLKQILGHDAKTGNFENGAIPLSLQWMHGLKDKSDKGIEHFGFREAASNPIYKRATDERVTNDPASKYNNQVHIGEVLHGYPNEADHGVPANGAKSDRAKAFLLQGSFLVIRKLRQDVSQLNEVIDTAVQADNSLSKPAILAKMMGRWPADATDKSGTPIEGQALTAENPSEPNNFNFNDDAKGESCPFHAHIRRANPRAQEQSENSVGQRPPRIVRRGMTYGELYTPQNKKEDDSKLLMQERGLIFMAYNASIGEQFEVIQRWISGGNSTGTYSGHSDPFLGVAAPGRPRVFQFVQDDKVKRIILDGSDEIHSEAQPLVRLEWGVYSFTPSFNALQHLAKRASLSPTPVLQWSSVRGEEFIRELRALENELGKDEAKLAWKAALEDPDSAADFKAASIWAAIRHSHGGVLETPFGVLVGSQKLADEVLLNTAGHLTAHGYLPRMGNSFGELYLGMDEGRSDQAYEKESTEANAAVLDLAKSPEVISAQASKVVHDAINELIQDAKEAATVSLEPRWQATVDIRDLIEKVIAHFCETWFGLSEAGGHFEKGGMKWHSPVDFDKPRYPGHFMAPSRYVFQPHPSETVRDVASKHGKTLFSAMSAHLIQNGQTLSSTHPLVKTILAKGIALNDAGYAPRTILGLMMGFVPTTDGMMRRIAFEWMREGMMWNLRSLLANQKPLDLSAPDFSKSFNAAFWQTFQLRAAPELLWRTAKNAHAIGSGADAVRVKPGDVVVVGQISATHEGLEFSGSNTPTYDNSYVYAFGDTRKQSNTAKPTHACPGRDPALNVIRGLLQGILTSEHSIRPGPSALLFVAEGDMKLGAAVQQFTTFSVLTNGYPDKALWAKGNSLKLQIRGAGLKSTQYQTANTQTPVQLFALGDSWVHQIDETGRDFHNLSSSLKSHGFLFDTSEDNYANSTGKLKKNIFNNRGMKLSGLQDRHAQITERILQIKSKKQLVSAVLMSAGGNDIAAHKKKLLVIPDYKSPRLFRILQENALNLSEAFLPGEKDRFLDELVSNYTQTLQILLKDTDFPILIHGYDFPNPDNRGVISNDVPLPFGPWLFGVFAEKSIDKVLGREIMRKLIEDLNARIANLVADAAVFTPAQIKRLHYVNLSGLLEKQAGYNVDPDGYMTYWANELHPTELGFSIMAQVVIDKLIEIGVIVKK